MQKVRRGFWWVETMFVCCYIVDVDALRRKSAKLYFVVVKIHTEKDRCGNTKIQHKIRQKFKPNGHTVCWILPPPLLSSTPIICLAVKDTSEIPVRFVSHQSPSLFWCCGDIGAMKRSPLRPVRLQSVSSFLIRKRNCVVWLLVLHFWGFGTWIPGTWEPAPPRLADSLITPKIWRDLWVPSRIMGFGFMIM